MSAEEMGKLTNRTRLVFAVSSVVFLAVLAISPFKDFRREWKRYKRSYLRFAQTRPDTKKLVSDYRPDIDQVRAVVRDQFFCVWTRLGKAQVRALVPLPLAAKILEGRDGQYRQEHNAGNREDQPRAIRQFAHFFSRHEFSTARPKTNPGHGKTCPRQSNKEQQR